MAKDADFVWRKSLLGLAGILVFLYAVSVLWYVVSIPDIGLRCVFSTKVNRLYPRYLVHEESGLDPEPGDTVLQLGDRPIDTWPQWLRTLTDLEKKQPPVFDSDLDKAATEGLQYVQMNGERFVRVVFRRQDTATEPSQFARWFQIGRIPREELVPSVLWFSLKLGLFIIGALVFWKRPTAASAQFFTLCIFTLGAYMGGYHWAQLVPNPPRLLVFIFCGVLLPAVLLHFYLIFPHPKRVFQNHPGKALAAIYGVPLASLAALLLGYIGVLFLLHGRDAAPAEIESALSQLRNVIFIELGLAGLWYLASVICLLHSFRDAVDVTERNQVKCILFGSVAALVPIGYTLYLAVWEQNAFAGGAATWPMFVASALSTGAFAVSITRYRLMQLDQIISSGVVYFLVSFLAGLVYYGVVFSGMLFVQLFGGHVATAPSLLQALWVGASVLVLMVLLNWTHLRLMKLMERRFTREKTQLDRTLQRLGQAIEQLVDPRPLAGRFLQASAELLGASRGAIFLREGEPPLYRLADHQGSAPALNELSPGCPLVETLQTRGHSIVSGSRQEVLDPGQRQLRFLGGEVAHALVHEGQMLALLVLGPREAGPYGGDDLNLIAAFARITAFALQSTEGHRTVELLNHDLQAKVEKISEQQRRILALQSQLRSLGGGPWPAGGIKTNGSEGAGLDPAPANAPVAATDSPPALTGVVGTSPAIRQVLHVVRKVAGSPSAILIRGESGTGKELLARAIHDLSPRASKNFVKVLCSALSAGLLESELFGHVKGAFTGAHKDKVGRFELANGGTLFLDEIGDISLEVQTKLLRVIQEKTFERVGSSTEMQVDVRIIAATHQDLEEYIHRGRFREDLYYRLNVIPIALPPLRERTEDIPELALHFLRVYAQRSGKAVAQLDDDALVVLKGFAWPGNIRQLENVIERAVVLAEGPIVTTRELPPDVVQTAPSGEQWLEDDNVGKDPDAKAPPSAWNSRAADQDKQERELLVRALSAAAGNKAKAARALGLARSTLISRLKKHGLS